LPTVEPPFKIAVLFQKTCAIAPNSSHESQVVCRDGEEMTKYGEWAWCAFVDCDEYRVSNGIHLVGTIKWKRGWGIRLSLSGSSL
jgi:hypothetical protein